MRSRAIKIPLTTLPIPFQTFLDDNNFDYEISTSDGGDYVVWIHDIDHLTNGYNLAHHNNFNKDIYLPQYYARMKSLLNKLKNNADIELYEEDINGEIEIKGVKYTKILFGVVPGKVLANLKRRDEINGAKKLKVKKLKE